MGYCMELRDSDFRIKEETFAAALTAIKALHKDGISGGWVDAKRALEAETLEEALHAWRWAPHFDVGIGIDELFFCEEKLGNDEILFEALAPFVEDGSYIELQGEDDEIWRWTFKGGKMETKHAVISWE